MMRQMTAILAAVLLPVSGVFAGGVAMGAHENGSVRPAWGRTQQFSWGLSGFLLENVNKVTGDVPVTDPTGVFDPIQGYGADNSAFLGLQIAGPRGTRLIFDRLVALNVIHVLGTDTDDQLESTERPRDLFSELRPEIAGFGILNAQGGDAGLPAPLAPSVPTPPLPPTPTPVPEPASAALLGAAVCLLGLRRNRSSRA